MKNAISDVVESDLCQDIWDAIYEKLEDKLSEIDEEEQA